MFDFFCVLRFLAAKRNAFSIAGVINDKQNIIYHSNSIVTLFINTMFHIIYFNTLRVIKNQYCYYILF